MSKQYDWTQAEIDTILTMREKGESFQNIANKIGTVGRDTIRTKFNEIQGIKSENRVKVKAKKKKARKYWSERDVQILTEAYPAGDNVEDILARLEGKWDRQTTFVKAASLGLKRPQNQSSAARAPTSPTSDITAGPIDKKRATVLRLAGLTPSEAAAIEQVPSNLMRKEFEGAGWTVQKENPFSRISIRSKIMAKAAEMAEEEIDRSNSAHLMIIMALSADYAMRNLAEVARLSLLPLIWIERVFGRLDAEGVWPVTDRTSNDLVASDYERFAELCKQEMFMLDRIFSSQMKQAA